MTRNWSAQQTEIFNWFKKGQGNLVVRARAGTGKTTSIIEAIQHAPENKILLAAFNKRIAEELKTKLKNPNAEAKTLHGVGFGMVMRNWRGVKLDTGRGLTIAQRVVGTDTAKVIAFMVAQLASKGKGMLPKDAAALKEIAFAFDIQPDEAAQAAGWDADRIAAAAWTAMEQAATIQDGTIDFDDMIFLPVRNKWIRPMYDLVVIDEAQDMNAAQLKLALGVAKKDGRIAVVGDDRQCQPEGTLVSVVTKAGHGSIPTQIEKVDIKNIKVGDTIVGYRTSDSSFYKNRSVTEVSSRSFNGKLVKVTTSSGLTSEYTPEHICLASFKKISSHFGVYLMRKGNLWRVGMSKLKYDVGVTGLSARLNAEGADEAWLLDTRIHRKDALLLESGVAAQFGIPTMMFTVKNNSVFTQIELDEFWSGFDAVKMKKNALLALEMFNREISFPIVTKNPSGHEFSVNRPREIRACNLLTGMVVLPFSGKTHIRRSDWEQIMVSRRPYAGTVYCLEVEGGFYVADGITTHNCIYSFRGADANGFDRLKVELSAQELGLTITYRCPKVVVEYAARLVPDFQAAPEAPEGEMFEMEYKSLAESASPGDFVLSRKNAPLIKTCLSMLRLGKRAKVEGRDVGATLIAMTKKVGGRTLNEMLERLEKWEAKQGARARLMAKTEAQGDAKVAEIEDACSTMRYLAEDMKSLTELNARIENLFSDEIGASFVICSSIHKAKGRETETVYVLRDTLYMRGGKKGSSLEEANLDYVAATRAKRSLVWVNGGVKPQNPSAEG